MLTSCTAFTCLFNRNWSACTQGMITLERPGRIRGITWTTNALAQIYYDKTLHVGGVQWDASGLLASFQIECCILAAQG
jgi:hypothetical protein